MNGYDADYQSPFPFTGVLKSLKVELGPPQLAEGEQRVQQQKIGQRD